MLIRFTTNGPWFVSSLSKLGLPGVRTGIVVANEEIIRALGALNAVFALASSSFGPALVRPLFDNGEIVRLSREVIKPYYHGAAQRALAWLDESGDSPARIHSPEGAFFMWLWCPDLPITSAELYRRLRKRNVLVVPGQYFFPGLQDEWRHTDECIRINYSQEPNMVKEGLAIIGEEVRRAYAVKSDAHISALWVYPIKSLDGVRRERALFGPKPGLKMTVNLLLPMKMAG